MKIGELWRFQHKLSGHKFVCEIQKVDELFVTLRYWMEDGFPNAARRVHNHYFPLKDLIFLEKL